MYPGDNVKTDIKMDNSALVLTSESATKIYPSKDKFAVNQYSIQLKKTNFEFINDELILYKDAKYKQKFKLIYDEDSTFFYVDILSKGITNESYLYDNMYIKNMFLKNGTKEYMENYKLSSSRMKNYLLKMKSADVSFVKFYIKSPNNEKFIAVLQEHKFFSFAFTQNKDFLVGSYSHSQIVKLKYFIHCVWNLYREQFNKTQYDLGKY